MPMALPNPRLEGISPVLMVMMDDDPSVVGRVFLGDKVVAGRQADGSGDGRRNSFSSDEDTLRVYGETSGSFRVCTPLTLSIWTHVFLLGVLTVLLQDDVPLAGSRDPSVCARSKSALFHSVGFQP